ncbi:MAG: hypothetical protein WAS23_03130 [Dokdonella sp.]|uniref:hypothetical protein n=1 Tax=Dokdonella sp. TaxID=2291710 RepID=UPI002BE60FD6|nr:hypothetical protein [Dokdonella sp.]HOX70213.1 hypothetical protein [Dokdonella sp.]HPN79204.1 hypothetical protein [Dokdonella sp.]
MFFALAFSVADDAFVVSITDEWVFFEGMGAGVVARWDVLLSLRAAGRTGAGALLAAFFAGFAGAVLTGLPGFTDLIALTGAFDFVAATGFFAGAAGFFAAPCLLAFATGFVFAGGLGLAVAALAVGLAFVFAAGFARATTLADLLPALDFAFDFAISVLTL